MKVIKHQIESKYCYIVPLSDLHIGDKNFDRKLAKEYIDWVKQKKDARVFLNGDILNVATSLSKSSPFDQEGDLTYQLDEAQRLLEPIKDKIIGAVTGN